MGHGDDRGDGIGADIAVEVEGVKVFGGDLVVLDDRSIGDDVGALGSVVFDPCGNRPADGDFLTVMEANAGNLELATPRP